MPNETAYPLINGQRFSSASVKVKLDGQEYVGFKSINYKDSLKPAPVKGFHPRKIGRTTGEETSSADMEMYLTEAMAFQAALKAKAKGVNGAGWKLVPFDIFISYSEDGADLVQDEIIGCRVTDVDAGVASSGEANTRKFGLDPMYIKWNGLESLANPDQGAAST